MKKIYMTICVFAFVVSADSAFAYLTTELNTPSLGAILGESELDDISAMDATHLQISNAKHATFSLLLGNAIFADKSAFGIYNINDPDIKLEIFTGKDKHGKADKHKHNKKGKHKKGKADKHKHDKNVKVHFDIGSNLAWLKPNKKIEIGDEFGFYLDRSKGKAHDGEIFYSQTSLNSETDNDVYALLFGTSDIKGYPDLVLAIGNTSLDAPGCDLDYNYLVVGIDIDGVRAQKSLDPVPEPATLVLLGLGFVILRKLK
jgi:hypothetical protein